MAQLPKDPMIFLSYINTHLRDFYPSLEELCKAENIERETVEERLKGIDYSYDEEKNQFI